MRSAGCVYNDIVDRDLDTTGRADAPAAAGERAGVAALGVAADRRSVPRSVSSCCSSSTSRRRSSRWSASRRSPLYPFMKRITWWPQAWLGLVFSWGALVGWPAVTGSLAWSALLLWFGSIAWVIGYDTLYAIQDIEDDALVGVKSSARRLGDKAPLGIALFYALALILWGAAIWSVRPDWVALAALAPCRAASRQSGASSRSRRTASWRCSCSARTAPAGCWCFSRCWSSAFQRARRALDAISRRRPPNCRIAGRTRDRRGSDCRRRALHRRALVGRAGAARRARGRQPLRGRADRPEAVRRRSDPRPSRRPICRRKRWRCWSSAAWRWPREAPEDPYRRSRACRSPAVRRAAVPRCARSARARSGRASRARAGGRESRARRVRRHQLQRRRSERLGIAPSRSRPQAASPALTAPADTAVRRASSPARARRCSATMPRTARGISTTSNPPPRSAAKPGNARSRGSIRPGRSPADIRCCSTRACRRACSAISPARSSGASIARRTSFLQDKLGGHVFASGVTIVDDPLRLRGLRSRPFDAEGVRVSRRELVSGGVLNSWIAESASARQLGIAPTGHAARGVSGAPGASPSNLYMEAGIAQPRGVARRLSRSGAGDRADRPGRERGDRRLQPRRGRASWCAAARSPSRCPRSPSPRT